MFSLYLIVPVTACYMSSSSHPSSCQNVTVNLICVVLISSLFPSFSTHLSLFSFPLFLFSCHFSPYHCPTVHFTLSSLCSFCILPPCFSFLQSLSTPQTQALSCVESLCCYQHGQSGCSRLAHLLEQMTGQCQGSANNCHSSSRGNRWGGPRQQETMIMNPDEPSPPLGFKNLACSRDCFSP